MISLCFNFVSTQYLCKFLHLLSGEAVNDTALTWMLLDKLDNIFVYILCLRAHLIVQVRTVERTLELICVYDTKILFDIRAHLICSRSRQCDNRSVPYLIDDRTNTTILRTEIMSPFRDTMCLIYRIERNLRLFQELYIILFRQRLRSHIEQFRSARFDIFLDLVNSRFVQRGIQVMSRTLLTHGTDDIHLVLHQSNQGGDNNSRSIHQQ